MTLDKDIIIEIEYWDKINACYKTQGVHMCFDPEKPGFIAPIGLYNIGDTIHFTKFTKEIIDTGYVKH